jgi:hypothetical protein
MKIEELKQITLQELTTYHLEQYRIYSNSPFTTKGERALLQFKVANNLLQRFESEFSPIDEVRFRLNELSYADIFENSIFNKDLTKLILPIQK